METVDELLETLLTPAAQIAITMGLAEVLKRTEIFKASIIPAINILLGLVCGIFVYGFILQYGILRGIVLGVAIGLASGGLFSGIKETKCALKEDELKEEEEK